MKNRFLDVILAVALLTTVVSAFSYTWTPVSPVYGVISMSADGRIVCACPSTSGQLHISKDWGQTWSIASNAPPWGSLSAEPVALSATGSQIIACLSSNFSNQHWVFLSTDFGSNWTRLSLPTLTNFDSYCLACSADGSNAIAAATPGPLYFSTNSGLNWSTSSAPNTNWSSVASSADGRRMVASVNGGRIYFSSDLGATWTPTNLPVQPWNSVCVSADGKSDGASSTNTYISRNGGANWITNKLSGSIACSADGKTWMIAGAQVYTSSDGGVTWSTNFPSLDWSGTMSADGCELVISQYLGSGGGLTNYVGRITPTPQLNIQPQDTNIAISWLLPSTNFVLQQNSDLATTNWTAVPTAPKLNLNNLQQAVTVPAQETNTFFRLITQ